MTRNLHRPLLYCTALMAALALLAGVGLIVDDRLVTGEPIWLKPFKFAVSFALYAGTLSWMIGRAVRLRRTLWWIGTLIAVLFVVPEFSAITFQAARGVPSHFNLSTTLDSTAYMVMGGAAYLGWIMTLAVGLLSVFQRGVDRAMAWAIPLGLAVSLGGMSVGYLMTAPSLMAHTVGAPDGGPGMALTGWSTEAGDLRVAHFVGLHALQFLPLLAVLLKHLSGRFPLLAGAVTRIGLVVTAALGYTGLTGLLVWQAQRGQALLDPDGRSLAAAGVLILAVALLSGCWLIGRAGSSSTFRRGPVRHYLAATTRNEKKAANVKVMG